MIMPYGKYRNQDIASLPSGYLRWLAENIKENDPLNFAICRAADKEYQFRETNNCHTE